MTAKKKKVKKDFERKKFKVGKLKPGAANATDTSFKAKRICLRDQQISRLDANNSDPSIRFQYPFSHTRHPNLEMRKEAYISIQKYLREYSNDDLLPIFGKLIEILSSGLVDKDDAVRSIVVALNVYILEREFPTSIWKPFFTIWVQFTSLALCHLQHQIRSDVLKVLDKALQCDPEMLRLVVPHFCQLAISIAKNIDDKKKNPLRAKIIIKIFKVFLEERNKKYKVEPLVCDWEAATMSFRNQVVTTTTTTMKMIGLVRKAPPLQTIITWSREDLKFILGKLLEDMADSWFDTMHCLAVTVPSSSSSFGRLSREEQEKVNMILDRVKTTRKVFNSSQIEDEEFWSLIPKSMISTIGPNGLQVLKVKCHC